MMNTFLLLLLTELSFTCLLSFSIYGDRWWSHTHYKQWEISRHILYYKQLINSLSLLINSLIKVVILNSWHDTHFKKKTSGFKNSVTQLQIETQLKKEIWWTMQVFLKARKDNFCYSSWLHPKKTTTTWLTILGQSHLDRMSTARFETLEIGTIWKWNSWRARAHRINWLFFMFFSLLCWRYVSDLWSVSSANLQPHKYQANLLMAQTMARHLSSVVEHHLSLSRSLWLA